MASDSRAPPSFELPTPTPVTVPLGGEKGQVPVIAFYCPGNGLTEWDRRTGGAAFGNFWPLGPGALQVRHNGVEATFSSSEAAYQSMKWWQHEPTRRQFEAIAAPGLAGGEEAYLIKKRCERDSSLAEVRATNFDGLGNYGSMLCVLRAKWRIPELRRLLLSTSGVLLVEHCEVAGRDLYWTDNFRGGGQNRLGAALMVVRDELLAEEGAESGWPENVPRPRFHGGEGGWQETVDAVAEYLAANTLEPPLTAPRTTS